MSWSSNQTIEYVTWRHPVSDIEYYFTCIQDQEEISLLSNNVCAWNHCKWRRQVTKVHFENNYAESSTKPLSPLKHHQIFQEYLFQHLVHHHDDVMQPLPTPFCHQLRKTKEETTFQISLTWRRGTFLFLGHGSIMFCCFTKSSSSPQNPKSILEIIRSHLEVSTLYSF